MNSVSDKERAQTVQEMYDKVEASLSKIVVVRKRRFCKCCDRNTIHIYRQK